MVRQVFRRSSRSLSRKTDMREGSIKSSSLDWEPTMIALGKVVIVLIILSERRIKNRKGRAPCGTLPFREAMT